MSMTYDVSPVRTSLEHERISLIPLEGLPVLPTELIQFWQRYGFDCEPPKAIRDVANAAIADFMAQHFKRRLAKLRSSPKCASSRFRHDGDDDDTEVEELD